MSTFIFPQVPVTLSGGATEATQLDVLTAAQAIETATEASQTSLASIAAEDFATQTTLSALNAKSAGSLAPVAHDEVVTTYVGATTRIDTVVYKLATVTVRTLTFSYDGSDRLTGVVAT